MQEKNKSAFTTSKITQEKNRRLQRQNLRENKKNGVYNVTDNVNQNRTRQLKHRRPIIEGAV